MGAPSEKVLLVVDDDPLARAVARDLLEDGGWQVHEAEDWITTLERLREQRFQVMLLDVGLPGLKGDQVAGMVARRQAEAPTVVLYSGLEADELGAKKATCGAFGALTKGCAPTTMLATVAEARRDWLQRQQGAGLVSTPPRKLVSSSAPPVRPPPEAPRRVLVVDDDPEVLRWVRDVLRRTPFEPVCASDWVDLSRELFQARVQLLILSAELPEVSGEDLASMIREVADPPPPILLWTSRPASEQVELTRKVGVAGVISKGIDPERFLVRVERAARD